MRNVVAISTRTLIGFALAVCFLRAGVASPAEDVPMTKQATDSEQMDISKKDWRKGNPSMMNSWGKRAWQNLQGGWGKRDLWGPSSSYPLYVSDKRAWKNLQGGWGKRFATDEEYAMKLAALMAEQEQDPDYSFNEDDTNNNQVENNAEDEKRAWRSLNGGGGWGKRAQWSNFRGSWGKRDPAWTNLKGIWGKRSSELDRIAQ